MEQNKAILISTKSIATYEKTGIVKPNNNHFVIDNTGNLEINPANIVFDTKYANLSSITKIEKDISLLKSDLNNIKNNSVVLNLDQNISGKKTFERPISIVGTNLNEYIGNLELRSLDGVNNFISFTKNDLISADSTIVKFGVSNSNPNICSFIGGNDILSFDFNKPIKMQVDPSLIVDPKHVITKEILTNEVQKLESIDTNIKKQIQNIEDVLRKIEGGTTLIGTIQKTKDEVVADNNLLSQFVQTQESRAPKHGDLVLTSDGYEFKFEDFDGSGGKWKDGGKKTVDKATNLTLGVVKGNENEIGKIFIDANGEMNVNGFTELTQKVESNNNSIKSKANQTDLVSLQKEVGKSAKIDQTNNFVALNNFSDVIVDGFLSTKGKVSFEGSDQVFGQISIKKNRSEMAFIDFNDGEVANNIYGSIGYIEASENAEFNFNSQKGEFNFNKAIKSNVENSNITDPKHLITKDFFDIQKRNLENLINNKAEISNVIDLNSDQTINGNKTFSKILKYTDSVNVENDLDLTHKKYVDSKFASIPFDNYYDKNQINIKLAEKANNSEVLKLSGDQTLYGNITFNKSILFNNGTYINIGGINSDELHIVPDLDNKTLIFGNGSNKHFNIDFKQKIVKGVPTPTENDHATNKEYVDSKISSIPPTDLSNYYNKDQSNTTFATKSELGTKVDESIFNSLKSSVDTNKSDLLSINKKLETKVENSEYQVTKELAKTNEQNIITKANQSDLQSLTDEVNKIKGKGLFVQQSNITKTEALSDTSKLTKFVKDNTTPTRDPIIGDQVITSDSYVFIYAKDSSGSGNVWVSEQQTQFGEATTTDLGLVKYGTSNGDVIKGSKGQMNVMGWDSVLLKSGGEMSGALVFTEVPSYKTDVTLTDNKQLANKGYVDSKIESINVSSFATKDELNSKANLSQVVLLTGDQMIGGNKTFNNGISFSNGTKFLTDGENLKIIPNVDGSYIYLGNSNGGKYFNIDFKQKIVKGVPTPTENDHATNKEYVDSKFSSISFDNYYDKNQINTELSKKVDKTELNSYSTTEQINQILQTKANNDSVYPKTDVFNKTESNERFASKSDLINKANDSEVVKITSDQVIDGVKTFSKNTKFGENNLIIMNETNGDSRIAPLQDNRWLHFTDGINKSWSGINFNNIKLTNVPTPTQSDHAVNMGYVNEKFSNVVTTSSNQTITGQKLFSGLAAFGHDFLVKRAMNGSTANYIAFYTDAEKTAEIGFTSGSDNDFIIKNNKPNGNILVGCKLLLDPSISLTDPKQFITKEFAENLITNLNLNQYATTSQVEEKLNTKANINDVYNKSESYSRTESDQKYVGIDGDQVINGVKTFNNSLKSDNLQIGLVGNNNYKFSVDTDSLRISPISNGKMLKFSNSRGLHFSEINLENVVNLTGIKNPSNNKDAANKEYVDNKTNSKADSSTVASLSNQVEINKQSIENLNTSKVNNDTYTTKIQELESSISNKANISDVYNKNEIDTKESTLEASLEQKANVNDVYNKGQSDSKYALINGDQTLGGNKTFTGITTLLNEQTYKKVTGRSANYFSFYQDNSRTAYLGHGSAANKDFTIATETENGSIVLNPHGNGVINVSNKRITNVALPTSNLDAINKQYFDNALNNVVKYGDLKGSNNKIILGWMSNDGGRREEKIVLEPDPTNTNCKIYNNAGGDLTLESARKNTFIKGYKVNLTATQSNGSIELRPNGNGTVDCGNKRVSSVANPTQNNDAINKQYFDNAMNSKADTNYVDTQINAKVVNVVSLNTEADINSMPDNTFGFYLRS